MLTEVEKAPRLAARIGQRLRDIRKAKGWTLLQVADRCGSTPQTIQRLETANMTMSLEWLETLCKVLGCDPGELFAQPNDELAITRAKLDRTREEVEIFRMRTEQFQRHIDAFLGETKC